MAQSNGRLLTVALLSTSAAAYAQTPASAPASQVAPGLNAPEGPSWLVADVGIALVIGLIVGYVIGAWRSASKARASHA